MVDVDFERSFCVRAFVSILHVLPASWPTLPRGGSSGRLDSVPFEASLRVIHTIQAIVLLGAASIAPRHPIGCANANEICEQGTIDELEPFWVVGS
jgi:hypothetical protein